MEGIKIDVTSVLVGAAAGLAAGGVLGYILARRSLIARFESELEDQIAAAKHHYQLRAEAAAAESADAVERSVSSLANRLGQPGVKVGLRDSLHGGGIIWIDPADLIVQEPDSEDQTASSPPGYVDDNGVARDFYGNALEHVTAIKAAEKKLKDDLVVFDPNDPRLEGCADADDEDEENEEESSWPPPNRIRTLPYVISEAEFAAGTDTFHQCISITWYDEDKVLVDEHKEPIPNIRQTTGQLSKASFGGVSGDPHIVYIRNENLEVDFEVKLNEGAYVKEVLNYGNPNSRNK